MSVVRSLRVPVAAMAAVLPCIVYATNGMNLEGYGPESLGSGGVGMAYDNGSAATMNNPATIGLMPEGHRSDFAVGKLGPDVSATETMMTGEKANSSGTAYYMPALGWLSRHGSLGYGVGLFAQGGMGTEYKSTSFLAAGSGEKVRTELGVGRLIFPISFELSPGVIIGGSVDFVWAGLDLKMAMSGAQFADLTNPAAHNSGEASGSLVDTFGAFVMGGLGVNWARFDFNNNNPNTGEAMGTGFAGKIGAVFKLSPQFSLGATYHSKTALSDLESSDAKVTVNADATAFFGPGYEAVPLPLTGKIKVNDFQWPAMLAIGAAFNPMEQLMLGLDIKRIFWADVMENFSMTFTADQSATNDFTSVFGPGSDLRGQKLDAKLYQNWEDQTVIALGGAYKVTPEVTLRLGYNRGKNPIPDKYLNALFPAIEETHVTGGVGYRMSNASSVDFALSKGLETSATNSQNGVKSTMSQLNWQLMYSYRY